MFKHEECNLECITGGGETGWTHVLRVPDVISSVTSMMHLWPFTVDFHESWKRTMFGCCSPFSISTSSLKRCRSALVSLRVCREVKIVLVLAEISTVQLGVISVYCIYSWCHLGWLFPSFSLGCNKWAISLSGLIKLLKEVLPLNTRQDFSY